MTINDKIDTLIDEWLCDTNQSIIHEEKWLRKKFEEMAHMGMESAILGAEQQMKKWIPELRTTGILGIGGTAHRDGVVNEGYNVCIDEFIANAKADGYDLTPNKKEL